MASHAYEVPNSPKIKALKERHSALEDRIHEAMKSPSTASADFYLKQLKKQKLILKDTIEIMSGSTANH